MRNEPPAFDDDAHRPLFVHGWWRSATTYLFAKLRGQPGLRCYYEPLHEKLARLTLEQTRAPPQRAGYRAVRHPALERHYWAEYEPLLLAGGTGYQTALAYERYLLQPDEPDADLERYLAVLIESAKRARQRAALGFVRSPMRALWMKRRFGGLHVAQLRNPRDQWRSFNRGVGRYFVDGMACIATHLEARFPRAFAHLQPMPRAALAPERGFRQIGTPVGPRRQYALFFLLWLASALQSLSAADIVFDCDRLTSDAEERRRVASLFLQSGIKLDLEDIAAPSYGGNAPGASEAVESLTLEQLRGDARALVVADPARVEAALAHVSPASAAPLQVALAALRG